VEADSRSDRAPLHQRTLDADELHRLIALRAASADHATVYAAVLSALVAAKVAYRLQVRTDDLVGDLAALGIDRGRVDDALRQLQEWGCVAWVQDTTFAASSIEEYLRRHELWELTPAGEATHDAIVLVLGASERSGALQRALFRQIGDSLDRLKRAVETDEAQGVYLQLRTLDQAVADLARNARDFHATIARTSREDRLDEHVFLAYKEELIAYLQTFHDDLVRNRVAVMRQLTELDRLSRQHLLDLASQGDDSVGLLGVPASWEQRWDGMRAWFVAEPPAVSGIEQLAAATTVAIRELLALLRRLTEATTRPIDRASELAHLARWFVRLDAEAAHELFDVAFGLGALTHLSIGPPDPDQVAMSTSWWRAEPAPVPITLREHGRRPSPGRPPPTADFSTTKQYLDDQRRAEGMARNRAVADLRTIDLRSARLTDGTWAHLLSLLDSALSVRDVGDVFEATVHEHGVALTIRAPAAVSTIVRSERGELVLHGCALEVLAVAEAGAA
jgi:uncharacterized protein (TIGR02677 family)